MRFRLSNVADTIEFGRRLGQQLGGGEVIELIGDVGSGKTTLVKGIASGLRVVDPVQSPTFTISRLYDGRDDLRLAHYDFYRLNDAGIMRDELAELTDDETTITILEWAGLVEGVLPEDRLTIRIDTVTEQSRQFDISAGGPRASKLLEGIT